MKTKLLVTNLLLCLAFTVACNPEEASIVTEDDSEPVGDTDIPIDPSDDEPEERSGEFISDIFFVHSNRLVGIRDDFFEVDNEDVGEMGPPFLSISLPPSTSGTDSSAPFVFRANTEEISNYTNLRLAVASGSGAITVVGTDGIDSQNWDELWTTQLPSELNASPTIYGNGTSRTLLYADFSGTVHALNADTGAVNWTFPNPQNSPYVANPLTVQEFNLVIAVSLDGRVYALNAQNGNLVWSYDTGDLVFAKPYFHENSSDGIDSVVVATQLGDVFRINVTNGDLLWNINLGPDRFSATQSQAIFSAPSSDGSPDGFFIASANRSVFRMDIETGSITWENNIALEGFRSSINTVDESQSFGIGFFGTLYRFTRSGSNSSEFQWTELQLPNAGEGGIVGSPVIVESGLTGYDSNRIYIKTANTLYGIDQETYEVASQYVFSSSMGSSESSPVVIGTSTFDEGTRLFYPPNTDKDVQN